MTKTKRQELSYDGRGINGPDEYRTRIATFTSQKTAKKYGVLFETAPELLATANEVNDSEDDTGCDGDLTVVSKSAIKKLMATVKKAGG